MSIKRKIGGKKAKNNGKNFETILLKEAYSNDFLHIKIPDGCKQLTYSKMIRVKSPFDFVFFKQSEDSDQFIFCDAKTISQNTFNHSLIKPHQVEYLMKIKQTKNTKSGYIINFEKLNKVVFINSVILRNKLWLKLSISPTDGIELGHKFRINLKEIFKN